jgi:hypothetical protein
MEVTDPEKPLTEERLQPTSTEVRQSSPATPVSQWKRMFLGAAGFGAGAVLTLSLIVAAVVWKRSRPLPWNDHAFSATFDTIYLATRPQSDSYLVEFKYDIQNNTDSTYRLNPDSLVLMGQSSNGSLKEWGFHQTSEPTLTGPAFIPAHAKAEIVLHISYAYPNEFTPADKSDLQKVLNCLSPRLKQLGGGIVIFDEAQHYRIDLPRGWQESDNVKKLNDK